MNCQEVNKFSQTYLDGEFASHERGEFEEHLRRCAPCRMAVDREALLRDVVARHLRPAPCAVRAAHTAALRGKVCAQFDRLERRQRNRAIGASVASVAVVAIAVAVTYGVPGDRTSSNSARPVALREPPGRQVDPRTAVAVAVPSAVAPVPKLVPQAMPAGQGLAARVPVIAAAAAAANPQVMPVTARVALGPDRGQIAAPADPFGALRSPHALRQLVQVHLANLQPEVTGSPARIQRYLQARAADVGALPLAQGTGVQLIGARIHVIGGQPAIIYQYAAFGSALTVVSRPRAAASEGDIEPSEPQTPAAVGLLLDRFNGMHLLHAVSAERVLTLVGELSPQAMVQLLPAAPIL
ncbi:MAG: zf-HC2 domain-containing protein [Deltaproteobacteria bacterium]|nr:zf-HC2 domain-containing protein [Deltaproteobacteria bacterium]